MSTSYHHVSQPLYRGTIVVKYWLLAVWRLPKKITLSSSVFNVLLATAFVFFYNFSLWKNVFKLPYPLSLWNVGFYLSLFVFLVAFINILLLFTTLPYLRKPLLTIILISAASASYFMDTYGILIDWNMIQNTVETDVSEAAELLSGKLFFYVVFLGVVPTLMVWRVTIKPSSVLRGLAGRLISGVASILIIILILMTFYQDYSSFFRNNRYLRHLINPVNFIYATATYASSVFASESAPPQAIALDALRSKVLPANGKHNLTVLVVGEAARAANFSLNGYRRVTNPKLQKQDVINFTNASSCGTATAVSVPCMFSKFERSDYSHSKSEKYEGLLDVLSRVGLWVLWRENNSGCKGACDRVPTDELSHANNELWCNSKECFDEILLNKLDEKVEYLDQDVFIVLHQKGSHGPSYFQRYPKAFEQFTPVCKTNQLQECSRQEITNAYDNSLLYTDHFLNEVIEFLNRQSPHYNTSMIYLSDHGESLGENNIYLHGTPYFMAPTEQTHIPFLMWFSKEYQLANKISAPCLMAKSEQPVSQDNLFHSILGLNNITTDIYEEELDVFSSCRKN
ncbi:phosphoethanolamine transferase [Marinomonas transparens]|uniref:Phosphoethanolamine--lipid A transferase n=1 Tax=Marinomonas transparens TaxID=2795388 RepID=A0A934N6B2_9GAMM|nr:phosphoethanolamine--lipid A transferase [Marinomonas transparens]MBJ7537896.1 phosphoethanolamine--lipid A transferase [Marinomonas transparens]